MINPRRERRFGVRLDGIRAYDRACHARENRSHFEENATTVRLEKSRLAGGKRTLQA
jgi:hypothetical protein